MIHAHAVAVKNLKNVVGSEISCMANRRLSQHIGWLFPVLSAIFLALIFPPFGVYPLVWVALAPLLMVLDHNSSKRAFMQGWRCGIVFFLLLSYWIVFVTSVGMVLLILYLAVYVALFSWAMVWLRKYLKLDFIYTAPFVWCFTEYLRATVMTGFPWDNLGYAFYTDYAILQSVEYIGVSGLSFIAVVANVLIYRTAKKLVPLILHWKKQAHAGRSVFLSVLPLVIFLCGIIALSVWGEYRANWWATQTEVNLQNDNDTIDIALIQPNIPQDLKWDDAEREYIVKQFDRLTREAAQAHPDLIIWPESSLPGFFNYDEVSTYLVYSLVKDLQIPMVVGGNRFEIVDDVYYYYNSAYYIEPVSEGDMPVKLAGTYDKMHLVPYGEYIPNKKFLKKIFPRLESIVPFEDFSFGKEMKLFQAGPLQFGVSVCYEDIFPDLIRTISTQGGDFIVNITNDAWYKNSSAPYQHFYMAIYRAVENRISYVRCSNTGVTGYALPDGSVGMFRDDEGSAIFSEGYMLLHVPKRVTDEPTFYARHGDIVLLVSSIISILLLSISFVYLLANYLRKGKKA